MIGGGLLAVLVGLVATVAGSAPLWGALLLVGGLLLAGCGGRFLYLNIKQLGEGVAWGFRVVRRARRVHAERSGTR